MTGLVSITEAAALLTAAGDAVERSTLSRYIAQHSEALPLVRAGKSNLIDFELLCAHRSENVRLPRMPPASPAASGASRFPRSQSDGAARKAQADAEMKEMDLAVRRKILTPVAEVDAAAREAVALMQSAFERSIETEAASAALKYGWEERTVRLVLKSFAARGLDSFHREALALIDSMKASPGDGAPLDHA